MGYFNYFTQFKRKNMRGTQAKIFPTKILKVIVCYMFYLPPV